MARGIHKLTGADLRRNGPGLYGDGGGLWLQITQGRDGPNRSWVQRYTFDGRRREMGLGPLALVSLAEARDRSLQVRKLLFDGTDPIANRKTERATRLAEAAKVVTFDDCLAGYLAAHRDAWRNDKHAKQWDIPLRQSISPLIGRLPVGEIDTPILVKALRPVWDRAPILGSRLRGKIEAILDWATVAGSRQGENPARWSGHLEHLLPPARRLAPIKHHPAMPYREVSAFLDELRKLDGAPARALEFVILTAARSGEARGARWDEIDFDDKVWIVPASRMKGAREHRVPLSSRALEIVEEMRRFGRGGEFIFPGRGGGCTSESGLHHVMKVLGRADFTVHGFRSAFRDWCGECTNFPREVAEAALAHRVGNEVEQAYRRGDALAKRAKLMEAWASYCSRPAPAGATVTTLTRATRVGD
jgi:integrase